jgi:hypothetical protein
MAAKAAPLHFCLKDKMAVRIGSKAGFYKQYHAKPKLPDLKGFVRHESKS